MFDLYGRCQILLQHARVPCGYPKQSQGWPLGAATTLLPVAQRVNADCQSLGELLLGQPNKAPKCNDIIATGDSPAKGPADAWVTIIEVSEFQ